MYRCTICNADNKPDYMFNDEKCMDCVTELEWQSKEEQESYLEPYQDEQSYLLQLLRPVSYTGLSMVLFIFIYRRIYMRYISKDGWFAIILTCAFVYFPVRMIASVWFGV